MSNITDEDPEEAIRNAEVDTALAFSVLKGADALPDDATERGIASLDKAIERLKVAREALIERHGD